MGVFKNFFAATALLVGELIYVISPLDLLPAFPIDDIVVMVVTSIRAVREIKDGLLLIPQLGQLIVVLLIILIVAIEGLLIFK